MYSPVLFRDRSRRAQILLGGVVPAGIGALAGVLIGASPAGYWRGVFAGTIYGIVLLVVHGIVGTHAQVSLGGFPPLLVVITAIIGMLLAAAGGRIARSQRERAGLSAGEPSA